LQGAYGVGGIPRLVPLTPWLKYALKPLLALSEPSARILDLYPAYPRIAPLSLSNCEQVGDAVTSRSEVDDLKPRLPQRLRDFLVVVVPAFRVPHLPMITLFAAPVS